MMSVISGYDASRETLHHPFYLPGFKKPYSPPSCFNYKFLDIRATVKLLLTCKVLISRPKKVWCDVHTDGGGFTLVGMKDSPVSWTVPSNAIPVDPQGPPHWSSDLGDIEVLDFRVQISTDKSFKETQADW